VWSKEAIITTRRSDHSGENGSRRIRFVMIVVVGNGDSSALSIVIVIISRVVRMEEQV